MINEQLRQFILTRRFENALDIVNALIKYSPKEICEYLSEIEPGEINASNIPQYSSYDDGSINILQYLRMAGNFGPSFPEVGQYFLVSGRNKVAYTKYGENHAKLSSLLCITEIIKKDRYRVFLNDLGIEIEKLPKEQQLDCLIKLGATIPIVHYAIKNDIYDDKVLEEFILKYVSAKTARRRRHNTMEIINKLRGV